MVGQMMPFLLRRSGPDYQRDGQTISPRALVGVCEVCGYEGAPFGIVEGKDKRAYCGWVDGQPACVGKGKERAE